MKRTFKQKWGRLILALLGIFLALFVFRLIYGYTKTIDDNSHRTQFFESIRAVSKNYASKKYKAKSSVNNIPTGLDQKYEKVAEVNTKSTKFESEEDFVRQRIKANNALIQFEQKNGNKGNRRLHLLIGVPPERFDSLYHNLIKIGKVQSKQITKKDKTNEYKALNAQKTSLEKNLASLMDLKSKGGKIEEYINLENRILEIEKQLQELGVNLGDFDDENEFCTVKFSLIEGKEVKISFLHRIKVALEWTVKIYLRIMAMLFFLTFFAYLILMILEKLKVLERMFYSKD